MAGAVVILHPHAAREPVRQHKRRGRYPRAVTTIWSARNRRWRLELAGQRAADVAREVSRLAAAVTSMEQTLAYARFKLAREQQVLLQLATMADRGRP